MSDLTPEQRAYLDAIKDGMECGIDDANLLEYANRLSKTLWFGARTLHYALLDLGEAVQHSTERPTARARSIFKRWLSQ